MSSFTNKPLISIVALAALVLLFFYINQDKEKQYNWYETYKHDDENPYGTSIVFSLLQEATPENKIEVSRNTLKQWFKAKDTLENSVYLFIGQTAYYDQQDINQLLNFVERGNEAFIINNYTPDNLLEKLMEYSCLESIYQSVYEKDVKMNFNNPQFFSEQGYEFNYKYEGLNTFKSWNYFDTARCGELLYPLGYYDEDKVNFVRLSFGKGYFYFHSNPLAFSNYHIKRQEGLEYGEKVFSYMKGKHIYWDEASKLETDWHDDRSPLKYVLSKTSLRWSWYLTLSLVFIYILFHSKRKQRPIPITPIKHNSSIELTETIGRMYLQYNSHKKICEQIMKLYLDFIRSHYRLAVHDHDETLMKHISIRSGVPMDEVKKIFHSYKKITYTEPVTKDMLINFYKEVEKFYQICK